MTNLEKILIIIMIILAIAGICWGIYKNAEPVDTTEELRIGGVVSRQTDRGRLYSLFGTSSTTPLTFASTTADVFTVESPHTDAYTTSSVPFYVGKADLLTFSGNHYAANADSEITLTISGSNDNACENPVAGTNRANWSPIPYPSATTSLQSILKTALETITLSASAAGDNEFAFTIDNPNYNCVKVEATTASTTDDSQLWMEVSIQDK